MALNFPSSPTNQQVYTDDNAVVWVFDGTKWNIARGTLNKLFHGAKLKLGENHSLTSTLSAVDFTQEILDTGNYFNGATPTRINIDANGYYRINMTVFTSTDGGAFDIALKKNGATTFFSASLGVNQSGNYDEIILLNAGDYIELYASDTLSVGYLSEDSTFEITRVGYAVGSQLTSLETFSGVRAVLTSDFATTNTLTAVAWNSTEFDTNATALGAFYWDANTASRLTIGITGYYRLKTAIETDVIDNYTVTIKQNNSNVLTTANIGPSSFARVDEIYKLNANDYIELYAKDTNSTGSLVGDTFLEIVRLGI